MASVCQNEPEAELIIHPRSQSRLQVNITGFYNWISVEQPVITGILHQDISEAACY